MGCSTTDFDLIQWHWLKYRQDQLVWDRYIFDRRLYNIKSPYVTIIDNWTTSTPDDILSSPIELKSVLRTRRSRAHWMQSFPWSMKIFVHLIEKLSHDIFMLDSSKVLERHHSYLQIRDTFFSFLKKKKKLKNIKNYYYFLRLQDLKYMKEVSKS